MSIKDYILVFINWLFSRKLQIEIPIITHYNDPFLSENNSSFAVNQSKDYNVTKIVFMTIDFTKYEIMSFGQDVIELDGKMVDCVYVSFLNRLNNDKEMIFTGRHFAVDYKEFRKFYENRIIHKSVTYFQQSF